MSLFENDEYQWRETYFILFRDDKHPSADDVRKTLQRLNSRYLIRDVRADEDGRFETLTLESPDDYAGMDISLVRGDEVVEQTAELAKELLKSATTADQKQQIRALTTYRSRFDVYHFEQLLFVGREDDNDEDEYMDPGALLSVMERIAALCQGIIVDPQANVIL